MYIPPAIQTYLNKPYIKIDWLFCFEAKNNISGVVESLNIWTGADNLSATVDGVSKTFIGSGLVLTIPRLVFETGLNIPTQTLELASISDEMEAMIKSYEIKFSPISIYIAVFDTQTTQLVGTFRVFRGTLDTVTKNEGDQNYSMSIDMVSNLREGTRTIPVKKSDEAQRKRSANDEFRKYAAIAGKIKVFWGAEKSNAYKINRPARNGRKGGLF